MVKLNRIYTRTGDEGTSGLVDGSRRPKDDQRFAAIGSVDETNCAIGALRAALDTENTLEQAVSHELRTIQNALFDLGADLATPIQADSSAEGGHSSTGELRITPTQVESLERAIDAHNQALSPLLSFVLPGGSAAAAQAHIGRGIARRAERDMVALAQSETVNPVALAYINRLSDYLFTVARRLNDNGKDDILWEPGASQ